MTQKQNMKLSKGTAYALHALMYMARHITQLPVSAATIAKTEGIPQGYLAKLLQQMAKAGLIKSVAGRRRGYVFAKPPEDISLRELFEVFEGKSLFDDCVMKHCQCSGRPQNCIIYGLWQKATREFAKVLEETSVLTATWLHPEHRFDTLPNRSPSLPTK